MKKILFVCIGNSCRSQMAEGFARKYGADVLEPYSAGLAPAQIVQPLTKKVMLDKNIDIEKQWPKEITSLPLQQFDLLINMSGAKLPERIAIPIRDWKVEDPIGRPEEVYTAVRDQIEQLVMRLILELRRETKSTSPPPGPTARPAVSQPAPARRRFLRNRVPQ